MSAKDVWFKPVEEIPKSEKGKGLRTSKYDKYLIDPFLESEHKIVSVTMQKEGIASSIRSRLKKRKLDKRIKVTQRGSTVYLEKI